MAGRIELLSLLYFATYVPYAMLTRWMATVMYAPLGRPLSGLEILPATMVLGALLTGIFIWLSGWWRHARQVSLGRLQFPSPSPWTALSGVGTAIILFTVPLSFTFKDVSIPFMQLLMRGDVLIIAPLVDLIARRRVRWFSWLALLLVALGLFLTIRSRGGLHLSPLAIATVVLYTLGYFVRLTAMTRTAKSDDNRSKGYFVEEKLVAYPVGIACLALLSSSGLGRQGNELAFGFVTIWQSGQLHYILILSLLVVLLSLFSILILLDRRENTFCVAFERSASVLAGVASACFLALAGFGSAPSRAEVLGALLLVVALIVLAVAPRLTGARGSRPSPRLA